MEVKTRGRTFTGVVVAARMQLTAIVEWQRRKYVSKYERFENRRTRVKVHNPKSINAKTGDIVRIMECRPISKTKKFIITEKLGRERLFEAKQELMEESKVKKVEKTEEKENEKIV
ncbi:MAG TPA: 30S ribosomal protein S17 [Candidatus Nanoarchaeia archaeon]|nr:30S ribosomal protein S17 [Candidatus Nanoarchaeia archaeon]